MHLYNFNLLHDLIGLTPPLVNCDIWCPNLTLVSNAPSLKPQMKKPALNLPDDQPIAKLKIKQSTVSQKTISKKVKVTSSNSLLIQNHILYLCIVDGP